MVGSQCVFWLCQGPPGQLATGQTFNACFAHVLEGRDKPYRKDDIVVKIK
jgi:hypothetical protein